MIKKVINDLTPPIIKKICKSLFKAKPYHPEWVTLPTGISMYLDVNTDLHQVFINGLDPFIYMSLKDELSNKNLIIYDIGAHFGYHTLKFAKEKNVKQIYAFEPSPDNKERLIKNINKNPNLKGKITIIDKAISNKKGKSVFLAFKDIERGVSSASTLQQEKSAAKRNDKLAREIIVATDTLDNLISEKLLLPPDIIKMDIEGAETMALQGAVELLKKKKPILLIEIHTILNMYNIIELLNKLEYKYEIIHTESDGRCFMKASTLKN